MEYSLALLGTYYGSRGVAIFEIFEVLDGRLVTYSSYHVEATT